MNIQYSAIANNNKQENRIKIAKGNCIINMDKITNVK